MTEAKITQENNYPLLKLENITKKFGNNYALNNINLAFNAGEIHALVGENGAGKSTLIKIITGVYTKTSGSMLWNNEIINLQQPFDALKLGINAVHQEVVLCSHLTVAENIFLGNEFTNYHMLKNDIATTKAQEILDSLNFEIKADAVLGSLTIGQQQLVATARAKASGVNLIIFDEPTAYLTRQETDNLFELIKNFKKDKIAVIYISHRMEEIMELSDKVSVLRDGNYISTYDIENITTDKLISDMIGRDLNEEIHYKEKIPLGKKILEVKNLSGRGFSNVSLNLHEGEIVGLYGLVGAGRSEFALSLFGRNPAYSGEIFFNSNPYMPKNEAHAIKEGIALIPESRRTQGLCMELDIGLNINLPSLHDYTNKINLINNKLEDKAADDTINQIGVKTKNKSDDMTTLSGGNQQKVVIGKWVQRQPKLFIFDEPTAGVDVRTKSEIYQLIAKLLHNGASVLLISSYLPEVFDLSDNLCVFRDGKLISQHPYGSSSHEEILIEALSGV